MSVPTKPAARTLPYEPTVSALDATMIADEAAVAATQAVDPIATDVSALTRTMGGRTTVLPRVIASAHGPQWGVDNRPRYETLKTLGAGGMGEVALADDHDIERKVALKKLRPEVRQTSALLRFAEEIKVIGQLEHPNIVPIHDVGIDEEGQHYFVMKYVNGETLEQIIEKLRARDPEYQRRFSFEHRTQVFLSILQAIRYAHSHGIIHRDIKPANIMVGPFGEVTVMDWGLAKKIRNSDGRRVADVTPTNVTDAPAAPAGDRKKLIETQHGSLLGTPLYMSPEQAAGKIAELDELSDVYSLGVLFYEFVTCEHYLADKQTIPEVIVAIASEPYERSVYFKRMFSCGTPAELNWYLQKALEKDPAKRFPSVDIMYERLDAIQSGEIMVQCHMTAFKKYNRRLMKWVDRHQAQFSVMLIAITILTLVGLITAIVRLVKAFA